MADRLGIETAGNKGATTYIPRKDTSTDGHNRYGRLDLKGRQGIFIDDKHSSGDVPNTALGLDYLFL